MRTTPSPSNDLFDSERDTISTEGLWRAAGVVYRRKGFIVLLTVLAAAASIAISMMLPEWYTASARLLPPQAGAANPLAAALSRNLPSAASALLGGKSGDYSRYLTILSSNRMLGSVVDRFDLVHAYGLQDSPTAREDAISELTTHVGFPVNEEYEYLSVAVTDTDKKRAADMANFFVQELNRINNELNTQNAASYRRFIEQRYNQSRAALDSVLDATAAFQKQYGIFDLPAQAQTFFEQLGRMRAEALQAEIQYEALRQQLGPDNAQVQALRDVVEASNRKYRQALSGQEGIMPVPQAGLSTVARRYADLERERLTQQRILEVVGPLYEQARFDEERKTEALQIVDRAVPPVKKSAPKRMMIVFTVTLSAFVLAVMFVLLSYWWRTGASVVANRLKMAAATSRREEVSETI